MLSLHLQETDVIAAPTEDKCYCCTYRRLRCYRCAYRRLMLLLHLQETEMLSLRLQETDVIAAPTGD